MKIAESEVHERAIAGFRVVVGLLLAYHGLEVLDDAKMLPYMDWDSVKRLPFGRTMVYTGKYVELIGGLMLALGFFTRYAATAIFLVMGFITFFIGNGRFWYEDQLPFLFALIALLFDFIGGGKYSLDQLLINWFSKQKSS